MSSVPLLCIKTTYLAQNMYLVFQKKKVWNLHIHEDSFGAKILRDDCAHRSLNTCLGKFHSVIVVLVDLPEREENKWSKSHNINRTWIVYMTTYGSILIWMTMTKISLIWVFFCQELYKASFLSFCYTQ